MTGFSLRVAMPPPTTSSPRSRPACSAGASRRAGWAGSDPPSTTTRPSWRRGTAAPRQGCSAASTPTPGWQSYRAVATVTTSNGEMRDSCYDLLCTCLTSLKTGVSAAEVCVRYPEPRPADGVDLPAGGGSDHLPRPLPPRQPPRPPPHRRVQQGTGHCNTRKEGGSINFFNFLQVVAMHCRF